MDYAGNIKKLALAKFRYFFYGIPYYLLRKMSFEKLTFSESILRKLIVKSAFFGNLVMLRSDNFAELKMLSLRF